MLRGQVAKADVLVQGWRGTSAGHPPGSGPTFGFYYKDDEVAWVRAEEGIDLRAIVDEAFRRSAEPPS